MQYTILINLLIPTEIVDKDKTTINVIQAIWKIVTI